MQSESKKRKSKRRGLCACCVTAETDDEDENSSSQNEDEDVVVSPQTETSEDKNQQLGNVVDNKAGSHVQFHLANGDGDDSTARSDTDDSDAAMSNIDRLFSSRAKPPTNTPISSEAQEINKLQKSSRHYLIMLGALIFQAGIIYLGIALFHSISNIITIIHTDIARKSIGLTVCWHVIDIVDECVLGYIFIIFSKTLNKIALTPGR